MYKTIDQPSFNTVTDRCHYFIDQNAKEWNILNYSFKEAVSFEDIIVMIQPVLEW